MALRHEGNAASRTTGANMNLTSPGTAINRPGAYTGTGNPAGGINTSQALQNATYLFGGPNYGGELTEKEQAMPYEALADRFRGERPAVTTRIVDAVLNANTWHGAVFVDEYSESLQAKELRVISIDPTFPERSSANTTVPRQAYSEKVITSKFLRYANGFQMDQPFFDAPNGLGKRIFNMQLTGLAVSVILLRNVSAHMAIHSADMMYGVASYNHSKYTNVREHACDMVRNVGRLQHCPQAELGLVKEAATVMGSSQSSPDMVILDPEATTGIDLSSRQHIEQRLGGHPDRPYNSSVGGQIVTHVDDTAIVAEKHLVAKGMGNHVHEMMRRRMQIGAWWVSDNAYLDCREPDDTGDATAGHRRLNTKCFRTIVYDNFEGAMTEVRISLDEQIDNCICFGDDLHRTLNHALYDSLLDNHAYEALANDMLAKIDSVDDGHDRDIDMFVGENAAGQPFLAQYWGQVSTRYMKDDFILHFARDAVTALRSAVGENSFHAFDKMLDLMDTVYQQRLDGFGLNVLAAFWRGVVDRGSNQATGFFRPLGGPVAGTEGMLRQMRLPPGFANFPALSTTFTLSDEDLGNRYFVAQADIDIVRAGLVAFDKIYKAAIDMFDPSYGPNIMTDASMCPPWVSAENKTFRKKCALFTLFDRVKGGMVFVTRQQLNEEEDDEEPIYGFLPSRANDGPGGYDAPRRDWEGFQQWIRQSDVLSKRRSTTRGAKTEANVAQDVLADFSATNRRIENAPDNSGLQASGYPLYTVVDGDVEMGVMNFWDADELNLYSRPYNEQFAFAKRVYENVRGAKKPMTLEWANDVLRNIRAKDQRAGPGNVLPILEGQDIANRRVFPFTVHPDIWTYMPNEYYNNAHFLPASAHNVYHAVNLGEEAPGYQRWAAQTYSRARAGGMFGTTYNPRLEHALQHRPERIAASAYTAQAERRDDEGVGTLWDQATGLRDEVNHSRHFGMRVTETAAEIDNRMVRAMFLLFLGSKVVGSLLKKWARNFLPCPLATLVIAPYTEFETSAAYFLKKGAGIMHYYAPDVTLGFNPDNQVMTVNLWWYTGATVTNPAGVYVVPDVYIHRFLGGISKRFIRNVSDVAGMHSAALHGDIPSTRQRGGNLVVVHMGPSWTADDMSEVISSGGTFTKETCMNADYEDDDGDKKHPSFQNALLYEKVTGLASQMRGSVYNEDTFHNFRKVPFNPMTFRGMQKHYNPATCTFSDVVNGVGPMRFVEASSESVLRPGGTGFLGSDNSNVRHPLAR